MVGDAQRAKDFSAALFHAGIFAQPWRFPPYRAVRHTSAPDVIPPSIAVKFGICPFQTWSGLAGSVEFL